MPYILIERQTDKGTPISEIEIVTTPAMYHRLVWEKDYLQNLRVYILRAAKFRSGLGADSADAKRERIKHCCDTVEGCSRSFFSLVMEKEIHRHKSCN